MFGTSIPYLYDAIYRYKNYAEQAQSIIQNLEELGFSEGNLLELACGTGRYLEFFEDYFRFGIDLCDESLMYASLRNPSAQFRSSNMINLSKESSPFKENQFDVILGLFGAIGYIPPEKLVHCIENWLSLLTPNGILILEPWHFEPEEGEYKQFYSSSELMVRRKANVTVNQGWTNMNFIFEVDHSNGKKEELKSTERLFSHSPEDLEAILKLLGTQIIQKKPSDFQKQGRWYIQRITRE